MAWAAVLGHAFGPNPERGIYRTRDGGRSWQQVLKQNDSTGASDVAIDPSNPNVVFAGVDVDVIKAFVEAGLGVAVLPQIAFEAQRDRKLRAVDVGHLFEAHVGCLAIRKNHYLRGYALDFIGTLAPDLDRRAVSRALAAAR